MPTRRFEMRNDSSNKFWEVSVVGAKLSVRFGRIGSDGQRKVKTHANAAAARALANQLVAQKQARGYREIKAAGARGAAARKPPPPQPRRKAAPLRPDAQATLPSAKNFAQWQHYANKHHAWAYFRLQGLLLKFAQGCPGTRKEWSESFDTKGEALARIERVLTTLQQAKYLHVAASKTQPNIPLGDCPNKPVPEAELDERVVEGVAEMVAVWRDFLPQSEKQLLPTPRAVDASALAARWVKMVDALKANAPEHLREARFGKPASDQAIADAEKVLGISLPPSLRSYLLVQNGGITAIEYAADRRANCFLEILSTSGLKRTYREVIPGWTRGNEPVCTLMRYLRPISGCYGSHMIALDTRVVSKSGEYAVVMFEKSWEPRNYTRIAPDFGSFLRTLLDDCFMLRHRHTKARFDQVKAALTRLAVPPR